MCIFDDVFCCFFSCQAFKNLRSLEICGGGLTDAGVKNIKDLTTLTLLNLSQNHHLTDRSLESISGTNVNVMLIILPAQIVLEKLLVYLESECMACWLCLFDDFIHTCTAGLTQLVSLNISNSRVTAAGLKHLKSLMNLKSLTLESCKVTASDIKKLQSDHLPNLVSFRPE